MFSFARDLTHHGGGESLPGAGRAWSRRDAALIGAVAAAACAYFALLGLLQHWNFYTFGWDLGVFDQVIWNTSHGRFFDYSFRPYSYLGDHFSPVLVLLAPLPWMGFGPSSLIVVQALAFGLAAVPLYAAVRRLAGPAPAWLLTGAYLLSLPVMRAVTFDFHPEAFVPLLAFTAFWGLTERSTPVFLAASLGLLTVKEDTFILVLGMAWLAWFGFGVRGPALALAGVAMLYTAVVSFIVMPDLHGHVTNPIIERYGYLGDTTPGVAWGALTHPDRVIEHLTRWPSLEAVAVLLAGFAFLPLLSPRLLPPLACLLLVPLLADHEQQSTLSLHYAVVPGTFVVIASALALSSGAAERAWERVSARIGAPSSSSSHARTIAAGCALALTLALFAWKSPAPPSFSAQDDRFAPGGHAEIAESLVKTVPPDIRISVQSTFLPHLVRRPEIYEFPRVLDARMVILDKHRPVPDYAEPGFDDCVAQLPALGFVEVRNEDGVSVWQRSAAAAAAPPGCNH